MKKIPIATALVLLILGRASGQSQTQPNSSVTVRVSGQAPINYGGTVTSVCMADGFFTWSPSCISTTGTFTGTVANQTANRVLAGPTSGGAAAPTYRLLVPGDFGTYTSGTMCVQTTNGTSLGLGACGGGGSTPTGTGFRHVTSGTEDVATKLVDTADINASQVTYAKIQNVSATARILGRTTAGAGVIEELTGAQAGSIIGVTNNALLDGSNHTDTLAGTVARGDVIVANSTPKWARLAKGAAGTALTSDGTDVTFTKPTLYELRFLAQDGQFLSTNFPQIQKNGTNFPLMALSYTNQPATNQDAFWTFEMPKYDAGNLTLRILYYTAGTTNNVIWRAAIAVVNPDNDAAVTTKAFATDQSATCAASGTANRLASCTITVSNLDSLAAGKIVWIKITRDRTDTTTSPAQFVSARLSYAGVY